MFVLSLACALTASATRTIGTFSKGNSMVSANFGMKAFVAPHLGASYEYCILSGFYSSGRGSLGVGAYVDTTFSRLHAFNARVTLHNQFDNMDFYVGMLHGVNLLYTEAIVLHAPKGSLYRLKTKLSVLLAGILTMVSTSSSDGAGHSPRTGV